MPRTFKHPKITTFQAQHMLDQLKEGKVTVRQLMKEHSIGLEGLKKEFKKAGLEYPIIPRGRKPKIPTEEEIAAVTKYRNDFGVGYQKCAFALKREGKASLSARQCAIIYESQGLFLYEHEYKEKEERIRYVAKMVGQIWHTDLHQIDDLVLIDEDGNEVRQKQYIVAFLDDRSRFIIHASIILNKESTTVAQQLEVALRQTSPPARIVIDNGGEFTGTPFQEALAKHGIKDWRTLPYTPQQNGKMERWWKTYESGKGNSHLQAVVHEYNYAWRHGGLHELTGKWMTPSDMWEAEPHWAPGCPDEVAFY